MFAYLPNILSTIRILLAPLIFIAIKNADIGFITITGGIAILTDFFDGFLARRFNTISQAGKILDPIADKFCVMAAAAAAAAYLDLPIALLLIIIARDLLIILFGAIIIIDKNQIPVSNIWGKATAVVLSVALLVYVYQIRPLYGFALWLTIVFVVVSSISYFSGALRTLAAKEKNRSV